MAAPGPNGSRWMPVALCLVLVVSALYGAVALSPSSTAPSSGSSTPSQGFTPATIGLGSGATGAACSGVLTCSVSMSTTQYSVFVLGVVTYSTTAPSAEAVHGQTLSLLESSVGAVNGPSIRIYGFVYTGSTGSLTAYVNYTAAAYYTIEVADFTNAVVTPTYTSGLGTGSGFSTSASCSVTPTVSGEMLFGEFGVAGVSETTMTPGTGQTQLNLEKTTSTLASGEDQYVLDTSSGAYAMTNTLATGGAWRSACVGILPASAPTAPTALAAASETATTVSLTWTDTANQVPYLTAGEVYQAAYSGSACGAFTAVLAAVSPYDAGTVTGLTSGNAYCFEVTVSNTTGASPDSAVLSDVVTQAVPQAPTGLTVTAQPSTTTVLNIAWTLGLANPAIANQTLVRRATSTCSGAGVYSNIADGTATFTQVTGLTAGTNYWFSIAEWNSVGIGPYSACVEGTTFSTPGAPTGLSTTGATTSSVSLAWAQPSGLTVVNDTIQVGTTCGTWTSYISTGGAASAYTVPSLNPSTTYCFGVAAWSGGAESALSATLSVTTLTGTPAAPLLFVASGATATTVTFSWTDPTPSTGTLVNTTLYWGATCGAVVQGVGGGPGTWSHSLSLASTPTSGTVTGLAASTAYCFGIALWTVGGQGPQNTTTAMTGNVAPSAPTDLTYVSASRTAVSLSWINPAAPPAVVNITAAYGTTAACGGTLTYVSVGVAQTLTVNGLTSATTYYWEVEAWSSGGVSAWSSCVTGATQSATPPAPYDLAAQSITSSSTYILWVNPSGYMLTDNKVYVSNPGGSCGTWATGYPVDLGEVTSSYELTGLTPSSTYCIEVTAIDAESPPSAPLYVTTKAATTTPAPPSMGETLIMIGVPIFLVAALLLLVAVRRHRRDRGAQDQERPPTTADGLEQPFRESAARGGR